MEHPGSQDRLDLSARRGVLKVLDPFAKPGPEPAALPSVLMYSTSWCPYCQRARALLASKGVQAVEIDIEQSPQRRDEMVRRSGRSTVPQIFIGEHHVGGCDDIHQLDAAGGLDPLLRGHGARRFCP